MSAKTLVDLKPRLAPIQDRGSSLGQSAVLDSRGRAWASKVHVGIETEKGEPLNTSLSLWGTLGTPGSRVTGPQRCQRPWMGGESKPGHQGQGKMPGKPRSPRASVVGLTFLTSVFGAPEPSPRHVGRLSRAAGVAVPTRAGSYHLGANFSSVWDPPLSGVVCPG